MTFAADHRKSIGVVVVVTLVIAGALMLRSQDATGDEPSPAPTVDEIVDGKSLTGTELADALGLTMEDHFLANGPCQAWVGVSEEGGYCIEGLGDSEAHTYVIGLALRGVDLDREQLKVIEDTIARHSGASSDEVPAE